MNERRPRLRQHLGVLGTTAVALGAMIGAGAYVSIPEAAGDTSGSVLLAVLLGAAIATLNGLSSAELAAHDPTAGGAYQFARTLVHPALGFVAGVLLLFAALTAGSTFAFAFAAYFEPVLAGLSTTFVSLALIGLALLVNLVGVRISSGANALLVCANLLILVFFVVVALPSFDPDNLTPTFKGGARGLLQATALLFFAYTGYARPVTIAEEIREPRATIPPAVITALAVTTLLYLGIAAAVIGGMPSEQVADESAPLRAVLEQTSGDAAATLVSIGALMATSAVLITEIWGLSRLIFAMSRNGDLPRVMSSLAGEGTPWLAVLVAGLVLAGLTASLDLRSTLEMSSLALLLYYAVMGLCALRLTREERLYPPLVPALAIAANILVAATLPLDSLAVVGALILMAAGYYVASRRFLSKSPKRS